MNARVWIWGKAITVDLAEVAKCYNLPESIPLDKLTDQQILDYVRYELYMASERGLSNVEETELPHKFVDIERGE